MTLYRLVMRDGANRVLKRATIDVRTDRDAVEAAEREVGDFARVEVWQEDRAVSLIGNPGEARKI